jgi:hypothetical protein
MNFGYTSINKPISNNPNETDNFFKVLDANQDGIVNLEDL